MSGNAHASMSHDDIAELAFHTILICRERGVTNPLRQAHRGQTEGHCGPCRSEQIGAA